MNVTELELSSHVAEGLLACSMPDPRGFRYWGAHYQADFKEVQAYIKNTCENAIDRGEISPYGVKCLGDSIKSLRKYYE